MNNRPIKFRSWDEYNKVMFPHEALLHNKFCLGFEDGKVYTMPLIQYLLQYQGEGGQTGLIIQQFAGFLDITNQEVYEGDIVEFHSGYPNQNDNSFYRSKAAVEFKNGAFWPRPIYDNNDEDTWYNYELKDLKVIGNIFENPNLLK